MGRNKALLSYSGRTLLDRISEQVAAAAGSVVLVGDPRLSECLAFPVIADNFPGSGPLAGIEAALAATAAEWNLMVACDMPNVSAAFLAGLRQAAAGDFTESAAHKCVIPRTPDGRIHPLCAAYRRDCLETVRRALNGGERKVATVVSGLNPVYWPAHNFTHLQNVNTPLEWSRFIESQPA